MLVPWRGVLDADIQSVDLDYLNGKFSFTHLTIADEKSNLLWIPLLWSLLQQQTKNTLFKSPFLNAEIEGKYKLTTTDATNSFSTYYNPTPSVNQLPPEQQLRFKIAFQTAQF
jgi:hypothetical protein